MRYYEIQESAGRLVKRSEPIYATEQAAISVGTGFPEHNRASIQDPKNPGEVFSVMAGRK
jgi:hypothetical protein